MLTRNKARLQHSLPASAALAEKVDVVGAEATSDGKMFYREVNVYLGDIKNGAVTGLLTGNTTKTLLHNKHGGRRRSYGISSEKGSSLSPMPRAGPSPVQWRSKYAGTLCCLAPDSAALFKGCPSATDSHRCSSSHKKFIGEISP